MTISGIDFHIRDDEGRVLALVEPSQLALYSLGQMVVAEDLEGNTCKAQIEAIIEARNLAVLSLVPGSFEGSSKADWLAQAVNY
jgi:hypothetical protein